MRSTTKGLWRLVASTVLAAALLLTAATAAQADIELSETAVDNGDNVSVELHSLPAGASATTHVTAALCDLDGATTPADLGTRCKRSGAVSFTPLATFISSGITVTNVQDIFANWNFTTNMAGVGSTECAETGDEDCGIVVSYYELPNGFPNPPFEFETAEAVEVTF